MRSLPHPTTVITNESFLRFIRDLLQFLHKKVFCRSKPPGSRWQRQWLSQLSQQQISHLSMKTSHFRRSPFFHDMFNISSSISKRMVRPEWPARTPWGIGVHGQHDLSCITWLRNGFHMVPWYGSIMFHETSIPG